MATREFEHYNGCRMRDPDNCGACALITGSEDERRLVRLLLRSLAIEHERPGAFPMTNEDVMAELARVLPNMKEASVVMRQASRKIEAGHKMARALRHAEKLAWEVGTETEGGVKTLLQDSRGDLYREIVAALAEWGQT